MTLIMTFWLGPVWAQNVALMNPDQPEQAVVKTSRPVTVALDRDGKQTVQCTFASRTTGWVAATEGQRRLVVFDPRQFRGSCKTEVDGPTMAWIQDDQLEVTKRKLTDLFILKKEPSRGSSAIVPESGTFRDDVCNALEKVEEDISPAPQLEAVAIRECQGNCKKAPAVPSISLGDMAENLRDLGDFDLGNRCLINGRSEKNDPRCSFQTMIAKAKACPSGERCKERCYDNMKKMACENSPWRRLSLPERFDLLMNLGRPHAVKNKVDLRYAPCLASAETHYLEPMAKALDSCQDQKMFTSAGLGMTTATTLDHLIAVGFRSDSPWLKKPSYYVCKNKIFDILGSSAELQLEIMMFHVADNLKGRSPESAMAGYRGCESGQSCSYARKILTCVSCLRERSKDDGSKKGAQDPIECLSAAPEGSAGVPSKGVYATYDQYKSLCEPSTGGTK